MKSYLYIAILLLLAACNQPNNPTKPTVLQIDSVYLQADFRTYGEYYNSGHQVYAIDLLSEGLDYDSDFHISGSGCNLYLSDVFVAQDRASGLLAGKYEMDTVAKNMTFLRGMDFEGSITGTYLLVIQEDQIQDIMLFTSGSMIVEYTEDNILLDFNLYTADSTLYHATYQGPVTDDMYR